MTANSSQVIPPVLFALGTVQDVLSAYDAHMLLDEFSYTTPSIPMYGEACHNPAVLQSHHLTHPAVYAALVTDYKMIGGGAFPIIKNKAICHQYFSVERWETREQANYVCAITDGFIFYSGLTHHNEYDCPVINLVGNGSTNYAHWMTEFLPQLVVLKMAGVDLSGYKVLIDEKAFPSMLEAVTLLGVLPEQMMLVESWTLNVFSGACWLSPVANVAFQRPVAQQTVQTEMLAEPRDAIFHPAVIQATRDIYRELLSDAGGLAPEKIFIVRTPGRKMSQRILINEAEIQRQLVKAGFVAIDPSSLSFARQVSLFSRAKYIVSASGAALLNMLWAPEGARVVVMMNDSKVANYWYFSNIAFALGHRLSYVLGKVVDTGTWSDINHADFQIDPQAVIDALNDQNTDQQFVLSEMGS